jgi:hypothetical protein
MKPGDLVAIRSWNITYAIPINYVTVYDRTSQGELLPNKKKWERGDVGVLLNGRDAVDEMVQVLLNDQIVWVDEEMLKLIDETR